MTLTLTNRIVRAAEPMSAPMDDELVILNMAGDNYIGLDAIGRFIWELLAEPWCVDDLCGRLSLEFAATPEQIAADVLPFVNELAQEGLIRVVEL